MIFTKKVLILTVIAMLSLGVMALAGNTSGKTCSPATLTVTSSVVVLQGFEATATAYDATFCGAPCSCGCGDGPSIINRALNYHSVSYNASAILISQLSVKSNKPSIDVKVTVTQPNTKPDGTGSHLPATYYLVYYSNSLPASPAITSSFFYGSQSIQMGLGGGTSSPYSGEIDVVINGGETNGQVTGTHWGKAVPVGTYYIYTTFTISPHNTY